MTAGLTLSQVVGSKTSVYAGVFTHDYHEGLVRDEDKLPRFMVVGTWSAMSANRISHFFDFRGASMTLDTGCSTALVALHQAMQSLRGSEADMSVVSGVNLMLNPDQFKSIGSLGMLSPDGRSYAFDSRANGYGRGEGVATIVLKRLSDALAANDPIRAVIRETALNQDGKTETITTPSGPAQEELMRECYRRAGLDPRGTQYFEAHGTGTQAGDPIEAGAMGSVFGSGEGRVEKKHYLRIGSVKTNVGHAEAASGLAAVVKGVLCLEKGMIPPSINFKTPNPKLKLDEWRLKVATELEPWPESLIGGPRRLSVNNFGYGGTNAHVILESADPWTLTPHLSPTTANTNGSSNGHVNGNGLRNGNDDHHNKSNKIDNTKVLILSARDERSCQRMVSDLQAYLEDHKSLGREASEELLCNLSYTLSERRTRFQWVAAHQVRLDGQENCLDAAIQALGSPRFKPGRVSPSRPRVGMVFTGQGAQWYAMGRELLTSHPVFRRTIEEAEAHLRDIGAEWSLVEELLRDAKTTRVHDTAISIPVCVALQVALVRLLESWGITPTAVTSHSSGEIAAAFAVGALTIRQAMATAYHRAVLAAKETLRAAPGAVKAGMAAVGLGVEEVQPYLDRLTEESGKAVVACINSPQSVTISGDSDAVEEIEKMCKQDGVFARRLKVQQAYHSHHMDPLADQYRELLRKEMAESFVANGNKQAASEDRELRAIFSSAVTGGCISDIKEIASPDHWVGSLVQPVLFVDAFTDMVLGDLNDPTGRSIDVVLEIGPHTALGGPIREILSLVEFEGIELPYWGCLVRDEHAGDSMRSAAINLLREGHPLVMSQINFPVPAYGDDGPRVLVDLPKYPWNHTMRHWQESRANRAIRARSQPPHDLLGMPVASNNPDTAVWRRMLRVTETPWIRDHVVQGSVVYPGSGYVCLAIEAANQLEKTAAAGADKEEAGKGISGFRLRDVDFLAALVVPDNAEGVEIRTTLRPVPEREIGARGWRRFEVSSVTQENRWTLHAQGLITVERETALTVLAKTERRPLSAYTRHKDPRDMFANLRARGINHGPLFQNTTKIVQDGREARSVCDITIRNESSTDTDPVAAAQDTVIHPITLDAVVVSFFSTLPSVGGLVEDPKLPRSIASMWVSSTISRESGRTLHCDTSLSHDDPQSGHADVSVVDGQTGATVLVIQGLACVFLGRGSGATARQDAANTGNAAGTRQEEVCSRVEWAPDLSIHQPLALAQLKDELILGSSEADEAIAMNLLPVSVYFAHDALQALTPEDVARLKEQPHLAEYYGWLCELVDKEGQNPGPLGLNSQVSALDGPEKRQEHLARAASQSVDGELICRLGPLLAPVLRGECDAAEVLKEDGLLQGYKANAVRQAASLGQISTLLRKLAHKNPGARVLEIGAVDGAAATRRILEALGTPRTPLLTRWHITGPSSDSLDDARADLHDWADLLEFDVLDINKDPAKQNFEVGGYDIIVASQVLHGSKSVAQSVANMRSLLKPGGRLLLLATTQGQADVELIRGLLPSRWHGDGPSLLSGPILSTSSLDQVLRDAGFSGVDLEVRDYESDILHTNTIIMSTVPPAGPKNPDLSRANNPGGFAVVTSNKTPPPPGLVDLLSRRIRGSSGGNSQPEHLVLEDSSSDAYKAKVCVFVGEIDEPLLTDLDTVRIEGLRGMVTQCSGLLWVTTGGAVDSETPEQALSQGFLRVLRNEYVGRQYLSLDLDPRATDRWSAGAVEGVVSTVVRVLEEGFGRVDDVLATEIGPAEFEYAERDGVLLIPRIYKDEKLNDMVTGPLVPSWGEVMVKAKDEEGEVEAAGGVQLEQLFREERPLRLEVGIPGHLDTLVFVDDEEDHSGEPEPETVKIAPRAYGLSSHDVMAAMGQLKDRTMGLECAGVVTRVGSAAQAEGYNVGDHVIALQLGASFPSRVRVPWHGVARMPRGMSFEDAASLPLAFTVAYAALVDAARLTPGKSVLIHAAAGGVGQAALMLSKHLGVTEIYATAGSQEKREHISREHGIPIERIFNSRDASFTRAVLAATKRRGVDVVLNSLPGPLLQASLDAVAPLGHLVEIGKGDIAANSLLALASFSRGISLTSLDVLSLLRHRANDVHRVLAEIVRLVDQQVLKPVHPRTIRPIRDVQAAFRSVQTGAHVGKIVLSTEADAQVWTMPRPRGVTARPVLRPDASYLVVGGVGGIGRSIAHWLVAHGAKNLILLSRSAGDLCLDKNRDTDGALFVGELREAGCRVKPVSCDISLASSLAKALRACEDDGLPPVRGVVQGAMLLRDAIFEQMTLDDWRSGVRPKVDGTWNLHTEFSEPGSLDFMVMLSSVSGVLGIASQTNYAAGGSYEDAMAHWRQARGLPGVSIDLGPISDVGYVAETAKVAERLRKSGDYVMLDEEAVLRALKAAVVQPIGGHCQIIVGLNTGPGPQWDAAGGSQLGRDARYSPLRHRSRASRLVKADDGGDGSGGLSLAAQLGEAGSRDEAARVVGSAIAGKLADIFMIEVGEIDLGKSPATYGVDSLIAVELRNMLVLQAAADISIFNILQSASLASLAADVAAKSRHVDVPA